MRRARVHPISKKHVMDLFNSERAAQRTLFRLRTNDKLRHVGTAKANREGRPVDVYCNAYRPNTLEHDLRGTDFCANYWKMEGVSFRSGYKLPFNADRMMTLHGIEMPLEFDMGTVKELQQKARWDDAYKEFQGILLVITVDDDRAEELIGWGEKIKDRAWYTTFDLAQQDPMGPIWLNFEGDAMSLTNPGVKLVGEPLAEPA